MLCIKNTSQEPYFNMACEEYFFKNFEEDIFMLWRNNNAIIVGKHQNTLAEINLENVKERGIKVVRRLSGGGAVFHDLGNLNFTFIMNGENEKLVDFKKYTQPIIDILQKIGVDAKLEGRNDLTIDGKKFSGNAVHVVKSRFIQHGTLLFESIMEDLSQALKVNPLKFKDKSVKSVRSRVTNINEHLQEPISLDKFTDMIIEHIMEMYPDSRMYDITEEDRRQIQKLADEKYSTWEWNFGYKAKYNFEKMIKTKGGHIEFHLDVQEGNIENIKIFGDFFNTKDVKEVEEALIGVRHDEKHVVEALKNYKIDEYFNNTTIDEFVGGMF